MTHHSRKPGNPLRAIGAAVLSLSLLAAVPARAETSHVRIGYQFGFQYVPVLIMKHHHLLEKHAQQAGIKDLKVTWLQFSGGSTMNDALLSGNMDFGELGVAPFIQIWAKTRGTINVKAVASTVSLPMTLTTNNPKVKKLEDFTSKDRIALPSVKSSMQAITLQFAAAKIWGEKNYDRLDKLTVSMKHPDGVMAMLSQSGDITAHFTVPPFSTQELNDPKVHKVLDSYEVYGGQPTQDVIYTTQKFRDQNPKVYRAFLAALTEATATGEKDRKLAAEIFMRDSKVRMDPALVAKVLEDPKIHYTTVPNATLKLARFMERVGIVAQAPDSWKDMFFPEIHNLAGS